MSRAINRLKAAGQRAVGYGESTGVHIRHTIVDAGVRVDGLHQDEKAGRIVGWHEIERGVDDPILYAEEWVVRSLLPEWEVGSPEIKEPGSMYTVGIRCRSEDHHNKIEIHDESPSAASRLAEWIAGELNEGER